MQKVNSKDVPEELWASPSGKFGGAGKELSIALGRKPASTDLKERHPFDVEITRIPPGKIPYPYHSHSAQWEFYYVLSGKGVARHKDGTTAIEAGDAFIFQPEEPHTFLNDGDEDLVMFLATMTELMFAEGSGGAIRWGWKRCTLREFCAHYHHMAREQHPARWLGINLALLVAYGSIGCFALVTGLKCLATYRDRQMLAP